MLVQLSNGKEIEVKRTNNDINGNPRYLVHFLALGLKDYKATSKTRKAGLTIYKGKSFGGGFVFQSYNVKDSLEFIYKTLHHVPTIQELFKATLPITMDNGLGIIDFEHGINDYVITTYYTCFPSGHIDISRKRKNMIRYNAEGEPYFIKNGQTYYINEFMRTDY